VHELHSKHLQLNPVKTDFIWFGTASRRRKSWIWDSFWMHEVTSLHKAALSWDLGILLDQELSMKQQIKKLHVPSSSEASSSNSWSRDHSQSCLCVCNVDYLVLSDGKIFSHWIRWKVDCNTLLAGLPKPTIALLQWAQNTGVTDTWYHDHVSSPVASELQNWCHSELQTVCAHVRCHTGCSPACLTEFGIAGKMPLKTLKSISRWFFQPNDITVAKKLLHEQTKLLEHSINVSK